MWHMAAIDEIINVVQENSFCLWFTHIFTLFLCLIIVKVYCVLYFSSNCDGFLGLGYRVYIKTLYLNNP